MPASANASGLAPRPGDSARTTPPKAWPSIAPMKSVGVKTPPTVPEPTASGVTTRRSTSSATTTSTPHARSKSARDRLAPVAHDLRIAQGDEAEREARRGHRHGPRQAQARVEAGAGAQGEQEGGRDQAAQDGEQGVEADLPG